MHYSICHCLLSLTNRFFYSDEGQKVSIANYWKGVYSHTVYAIVAYSFVNNTDSK